MSINKMCTRAVEFRATGASEHGDGRTLQGYAAVFNQRAEINSWEGRFVETFVRGAFKKTLQERTPVMQFNHGRDTSVGAIPIGVYSETREDDQGVYVSGRLFDNQVVEPVRQAIEGGALSGMSISFRVIRDEWRDNKGQLVKGAELERLLYEPGDRGPLARTVRECQLSECGPVVHPAYDGTSVGVRATDEDRAALVEQYRRSMIEPDEDIDPALGSWLAAESVWKTNVKRWLDAEKSERATTSTPDDAVRADTSPKVEPPKTDVASQGTSASRKDYSTRKVKKAMNIHELNARAAEITERLAELGDEYRDTDMPAERAAEWDEAERELGEINAKIKSIGERTERLRALVVSQPGLIERGADRGAPRVGHTRVENLHDIDAIRAASHGEEDLANRLRDNALRVCENLRFSQFYDRDSSREQIAKLIDDEAEDNPISKRVLLTGSKEYERSFFKLLKTMSPYALAEADRSVIDRVNEEMRAMALGVDASGGYAVPVHLDPTVLLQNAGTVNPLRQLARQVQISGKEYQIPTTTGANVTRGTEGSTAADNSFTLGIKTVRTNRVQGFVPFSIEVDQDYGQLRSLIAEVLNDAKSREEATSFTLGDGTGVNANGVIGTLNGNTVNTGAVNTFAVGDVYNLENSLAPRYRTPACSWLASHTIYNKIRQFGTTDGHALWERIGAGMPSLLLGYNAYEVSDMVTTTTTGSKLLMIGDFSNFIIVDRIGMQVELIPMLFDQANGNRPTGQRGIYAIWRNNTKILNDAAFKLLVSA